MSNTASRQEISYTLYRMYDAAGVLLYVGSTTKPQNRLRDHELSKPWWRDVATIKVEHFADIDSLRAEEIEVIDAERPTQNWLYARPLPWTMKRRGPRGEGTLFQRGDGYWVAGIELSPGPNGKRRMKRMVRRSKESAQSALDQFKQDLANGR